jgi:hypothetical protein
MSSFSFCSSCFRSRERQFNYDFIYFTKLDFVFFCTLLRLFSLSEIQRWIVSLCDFLYVLFRSLRSIILHLLIVVLIIAKSLFHIISFQYVLNNFDNRRFHHSTVLKFCRDLFRHIKDRKCDQERKKCLLKNDSHHRAILRKEEIRLCNQLIDWDSSKHEKNRH